MKPAISPGAGRMAGTRRDLPRALTAANPERCVWASNWPHPNAHPTPSNALMLDLLLDWAPDDATRRRILVDNPARLYGF